MARTHTTSIPLGYKAPSFQLKDARTGDQTTFNDVRGENGTVAFFICNHCPFVIHVLEELVQVGRDYQTKGIGFVAISSNDVENYPDDAPEKMKELAEQYDFPFPYLYDETQEVAKAYKAACTPDISVFSGEDSCVYRGQLDDARPGNDAPVNGKDLRNALDRLLAGAPIPVEQSPSLGCGIKWKPGNAPDYA